MKVFFVLVQQLLKNNVAKKKNKKKCIYLLYTKIKAILKNIKKLTLNDLCKIIYPVILIGLGSTSLHFLLHATFVLMSPEVDAA